MTMSSPAGPLPVTCHEGVGSWEKLEKARKINLSGDFYTAKVKTSDLEKMKELGWTESNELQ